MSRYDAIVVGGGPAGLLCAGFAAEGGLHVAVAEGRERPARKILVTGKGRCNLTNNCTPEEFLENIRRNPKFLYSAIRGWPPARTMSFFEGLGLPLKTERGRRVFPASDRAMDVADALVAFCRGSGAKILHTKVGELLIEGGAVTGVMGEDGRALSADAVVLATGGMSYPQTGSDGSGYRLAAQAGHTITPLRPSLIHLVCEEGFCPDLAGLSLKNVTLTLKKRGGKKALYSELGEMLFTHTGISGPLGLSASSYMDGPPSGYLLELDLKPGLSPEQLDARILRDLDGNKSRDLGNILGLLLPRAIIPVVLDRAGIPPNVKGNQVTKAQRQNLIKAVKEFYLSPKALGPMAEAVVTAGGVAVGEVNPKTMASTLAEGLFFAGEILDVDGYTGGYNLQIAFSTGYAAARGLLARHQSHPVL